MNSMINKFDFYSDINETNQEETMYYETYYRESNRVL